MGKTLEESAANGKPVILTANYRNSPQFAGRKKARTLGGAGCCDEEA
jgi:hypothetical protein